MYRTLRESVLQALSEFTSEHARHMFCGNAEGHGCVLEADICPAIDRRKAMMLLI